ncbi:MAG: hypothetical protein ABSB41_19730 [Anaerolineales bacterium]
MDRETLPVTGKTLQPVKYAQMIQIFSSYYLHAIFLGGLDILALSAMQRFRDRLNILIKIQSVMNIMGKTLDGWACW